MKTSIKFYQNGILQNVECYKSKKEALKAKNSFLSNFTVGYKVKNDIQAILVNGDEKSQVNSINTDN